MHNARRAVIIRSSARVLYNIRWDPTCASRNSTVLKLNWIKLNWIITPFDGAWWVLLCARCVLSEFAVCGRYWWCVDYGDFDWNYLRLIWCGWIVIFVFFFCACKIFWNVSLWNWMNRNNKIVRFRNMSNGRFKMTQLWFHGS